MEPKPPADVSSPASVVPAEVVRETVSPPPPRRGGGIALFFFLLLLAVLGGSLLLNLVLLFSSPFDSERRVYEKFHSGQRTGTQKVAIISITGVILGGEGGFVKRQIDQAAKDPSVKAVVLRVDSPGGTVSGSHYYYHHLRKLVTNSNIPLVVSMGSTAASGGYYVSMAVGPTPDTVFAEPTTWTGSIGVIIPHYNLGGLLEDWGVKEDSVTSDRLKNMGTFARPMTDEERQIFQSLVDESFARFKDVIMQGRPPEFQKRPKTLDELATGQIFTAEQAKRAGLIDRIGFLEDAVDRAIELAQLDPEDVRVVKYQPEAGLLDLLLGIDVRQPGIGLSDLLELSAPRAYYLSTRLPLLISNSL